MDKLSCPGPSDRLTNMLDQSMSAIIFKLATVLPGFLFAIVAHEWAHAFMAKQFGDDTAERAGRLTFNPAAHYDMMGTIIFPIIGLISGWSVIGWARPVPVNPSRFSKIRPGIFWVSFAGPLMNFFLCVLSGFLFAVVATKVPNSITYKEAVLRILEYSLFINIFLGAFNLIPLPPLDGSQMLSSLLNYEWARKYQAFAAYAPYIILGVFALSFFGIHLLSPILSPFLKLGYLVRNFFIYLMV